eukprot:7039568-Prymnesium_polylepis.1
MIREIVTDGWIKRWKLEKKLAEWASDWGVAEVKTPTAAEVCNALCKCGRRSSGRASLPSRTARWCSCAGGCCLRRRSATSICRALPASGCPRAIGPSRCTAASTTRGRGSSPRSSTRSSEPPARGAVIPRSPDATPREDSGRVVHRV